VDDLLDLVEVALVRLIKENNDLRSYVEQLNQQLRAVPVDIGRDLRPVMTSMRLPMRRQTYPNTVHNAQVAKVLGVAREMADQLTDAANAEASRRLNQARTNCEHFLSEARVKARNMVDGARVRGPRPCSMTPVPQPRRSTYVQSQLQMLDEPHPTRQ
jgi:cell division septum initiation protein DivIVA